jgi:hypothetical protein
LEVSPGQSDKNHPRGSTHVITVNGVLPENVENIKLIYTVRPPFAEGKPGIPIDSEEFCQIKKKYFSSNFVIQLDNPGLYRLRIVFDKNSLVILRKIFLGNAQNT